MNATRLRPSTPPEDSLRSSSEPSFAPSGRSRGHQGRTATAATDLPNRLLHPRFARVQSSLARLRPTAAHGCVRGGRSARAIYKSNWPGASGRPRRPSRPGEGQVRCGSWRTERARPGGVYIVAAEALPERSEGILRSDRQRAEGFLRCCGPASPCSIYRL
jgi:hypothetical protein